MLHLSALAGNSQYLHQCLFAFATPPPRLMLKTGMQVTTVCLPILLLGITVCSLVPLAGRTGGWATFSRAGITTDSLRDLGLLNWNHTIDIGYDQVRSGWCSHGLMRLSQLGCKS